MAKSSEAFRTIGEVSGDLAVPKHVLRFWEGKFPQLKPMKRGGGRRFYRPEDVVLLRGIKHLLHAAGYTIKGVQRILREDGVEAVKTLAATEIPTAKSGSVRGSPSAVAATVLPSSAAGKRGGKRGVGGLPANQALPPAVKGLLAELVREVEHCLALCKGTASAKAPPARKAAKSKR